MEAEHLKKTEVNYCTMDKELLAVFYSVKKCEVYEEKLTPKWTGPFEIIKCSHPMYQVKLTTEVKISEKWLPQDRLRKVSKNFEPNVDDNHEKFKETGIENRNMNNEFDYESDDDDTYNQDEPYRSKLSQNPARKTYYDGYLLNYVASV